MQQRIAEFEARAERDIARADEKLKSLGWPSAENLAASWNTAAGKAFQSREDVESPASRDDLQKRSGTALAATATDAAAQRTPHPKRTSTALPSRADVESPASRDDVQRKSGTAPSATATQTAVQRTPDQKRTSDALQSRPTSARLRSFLASTMNCNVHALDAGGGGDCLFLSIAAGLHMISDLQPEVQRSVADAVGLPIAGTSRAQLAQRLRELVAGQLEGMQPEEFLDLLITYCSEERLAQQGVRGALWQDRWSPGQLLTQFGYQDLLQADSVVAVSANEDMQPEDITILYRRNNVPVLLSVANGVNTLRALQTAMADCFRQPGHMHWGTVTDVRMLTVALNIGCVVFSDTPQDGSAARRWIYGLNCDRGDFPLWMVLYNSGNVHFQLATRKLFSFQQRNDTIKGTMQYKTIQQTTKYKNIE